jgi:ATP/maltotriose-dependent transcriptional regulator MalT
LIEYAGSSFLARGKFKKLSEWLEALPEDVISQNPVLLSLKASVASSQSSFQESKELLDKALDLLRKGSDQKSLANSLIRRSAVLRMLREYPAAMADAEEAIGITANQPELGNLYSEALRAKVSCCSTPAISPNPCAFMNWQSRSVRRTTWRRTSPGFWSKWA